MRLQPVVFIRDGGRRRAGQRRAAGQRGFTLTELMVVVAITGIFAGMAMISFTRGNAQRAVDSFTNEARNAVLVARSRAIATGNPFIIDFRPGSVQYCERDPASAALPGGQRTCPTPPATVCNPGPPAVLCDNSQPVTFGSDVEIRGYDKQMNLAGVADAPQLLVAGGYQILATRNGAIDGDLLTLPPAVEGFTLYVRRRGMAVTTNPRKLLVSPASGRPRIVDRW